MTFLLLSSFFSLLDGDETVLGVIGFEEGCFFVSSADSALSLPFVTASLVVVFLATLELTFLLTTFSEGLDSAAMLTFSFSSFSLFTTDSFLIFSSVSFLTVESFFSFSFLSFSSFFFFSSFSCLAFSFFSFSILSFSSFSFSFLSFSSFFSLSCFSFSSFNFFNFSCFLLVIFSCRSCIMLSCITFFASFLVISSDLILLLLSTVVLFLSALRSFAEQDGYFKHSNFLSFSRPLKILFCGVLPGKRRRVMVSLGLAGCQTRSAHMETRFAIGSQSSFPSTLMPDLKLPSWPTSSFHLERNSLTSRDSLDGLRTYISSLPWPTLW